MRFGYGSRLGKLKPSRKGVAVVLGLLVLPTAARVQQVTALRPQAFTSEPLVVKSKLQPAPVDPRVARLSKFFSSLNCPVRSLSADFVMAADENHIDWRLLPSISVIESGGGKVYRNNNIFGWSRGNVLFSSIRHSIHEIAYKLGRSPLYRRRDTVGKLRIYNSEDSDYVQNVLDVMNRISPTPHMGIDPDTTQND
jgi:hypothetical protein